MALETFLTSPHARYIFEHTDSWATVYDSTGTIIQFCPIRFSTHRTMRIVGKIGDMCAFVSCKSLDLSPEEFEVQLALGVLPSNIYRVSPVAKIWCKID